MSKMDELCDELAQKALELEEATGDEDIYKKISDQIGNSSPTMQETFVTALRIRRAHRRAEQLLDELMPEKLIQLPAPEPEEDSEDD